MNKTTIISIVIAIVLAVLSPIITKVFTDRWDISVLVCILVSLVGLCVCLIIEGKKIIKRLKNENETSKNESETFKSENEKLKVINEKLKKENDLKSQNKRVIQKYVKGQEAKRANNQILKDAEESISSTRTLPIPGGNSEAQEEYKTKIESKKSVSRIWQLRSEEDLKHMETFLNKYGEYENYRLACFCHKNIVIPEILVCDDDIVSVTLPDKNYVNEPYMCYHFTEQEDVDIWKKYFSALWQVSIVVCNDGKIEHENLEKAKREILDVITV